MKKSCIIIEDNPAFVVVLESYIKKIEFLEILGVYPDSIGAAVSIFRKRPDLVFLDIGISGLTGPEMLETLAFKPKTIVISNHPEESVSDFREHIDAFLQKPIQFESFKRIVEETLNGELTN